MILSIFLYGCWLFVYLLWEMAIQALCQFLNWIFCFVCFSFSAVEFATQILGFYIFILNPFNFKIYLEIPFLAHELFRNALCLEIFLLFSIMDFSWLLCTSHWKYSIFLIFFNLLRFVLWPGYDLFGKSPADIWKECIFSFVGWMEYPISVNYMLLVNFVIWFFYIPLDFLFICSISCQ